MPRILPLPQDAIAQIHSSKQITSLQGVVLSLLENSLDAGATKVEIIIDLSRGGCILEDDGAGISPHEFGEDGGLGLMYHTSKQVDQNVHGSTGTYLASLSALSLVSITARHARCDHYATLTLHHGKVVARHVPAPASHEILICGPQGTRVTVRDLFGNMPVRVKQRALTADDSAETERVWWEIQRSIVALLLAWPKLVAVRLRDADSKIKAVSLSTQNAAVDGLLTEKRLKQFDGKSTKADPRDALPLLFQAGLAPLQSRQSWVPILASAATVSTKGAICLEPAPTKHCQFISIGISPCCPSSGLNELYATVNKVFASSSFGAVEDADIDDAEKDRRLRDRRYKNDGFTRKQLQGKKGVERWPMFFLKVHFANTRGPCCVTDDVGDTTLKAISDVLEAAVTQWLSANHFRPRKLRRRKNEMQPNPAATTSSPVRPSSATEHRPITPNASGLATPPLKRAATGDSAITSKKRRIIDLSSKPSSHERDEEGFSFRAHLDPRSGCRSGRASFSHDLWNVKKPATAPAGQISSICSPKPVLPTSVFKIPAFDIGEFNITGRSRHHSHRSSETVGPTAISATTDQAEEHISSEDFGSFDDSVMLAVAEAADRSMPQDCGSVGTGRHEPSARPQDDELSQDTVVEWIDPVTKKSFQVNARTGVVLPSRPKTALNTTQVSAEPERATGTRRVAAINTSTSSTGKALSLARRATEKIVQRDAQWLPGFLRQWNNPVFAKQDEEPIPVASFDGPGVDVAAADREGCGNHCHAHKSAQSTNGGASKLSKKGLSKVQIISQVDEKFILCKMPSAIDEDGQTLVLVDQHAASERVILEQLFAELCAPVDQASPAATYTTGLGHESVINTVMLQTPFRFHLPEKDSDLLRKHAQHFAFWGILYDLSASAAIASEPQVKARLSEQTLTVRALPPGIAERCTLFPNLLIELLRSEVWSLEESHYRPHTASAKLLASADGSDNGQDWLRHIGHCPKGIIDMLNSRACRSAIMFNDVLTREECERLLADLSGCAFPFMCAHGRVSMVPLAELGCEVGATLANVLTK